MGRLDRIDFIDAPHTFIELPDGTILQLDAIQDRFNYYPELALLNCPITLSTQLQRSTQWWEQREYNTGFTVLFNQARSILWSEPLELAWPISNSIQNMEVLQALIEYVQLHCVFRVMDCMLPGFIKRDGLDTDLAIAHSQVISESDGSMYVNCETSNLITLEQSSVYFVSIYNNNLVVGRYDGSPVTANKSTILSIMVTGLRAYVIYKLCLLKKAAGIEDE